MHGVDRLARDEAARDIGLVRHDDQMEARGAQAIERVGDSGQDVELVDGRGSRRHAIANRRTIEDPIAIQKDCPHHFARLKLAY